MTIPQKPYLIFSPFLLFYIVFVLIFQQNTLSGDEYRHIFFTQNLLHGYYSPADITLGHGPGYSLFLTPFLALKIPLLLIKLTNPFFYYLSIVFLFKALKQIAPFHIALLFCLFWACYYNSFDNMHFLHSEVFSSFLVVMLLYFLLKAFNSNNAKTEKGNVILSGVTMGYLILTKVIFGYVLLFMLIAAGLLWLINRKVPNYRKGAMILLIAFITMVPYLFYTYKLTSKIYYLSTYGGEHLYWMTTRHEGEYGSWFAAPILKKSLVSPEDNIKDSQDGGYQKFLNSDNLVPGIDDSIKLHHQKDFDEILKYSTTGAERDDAFKRIAIRNIKANPLDYVKNCFSNIGRILFNYPYSYTAQRPSTLLRFPLNGIIAVLMLFCIIPTFLNWKKIIYPVRFMLFFIFLYLGGSILGSAEIRMFTTIVPMLLFWIAFILINTVKINLKFYQGRASE